MASCSSTLPHNYDILSEHAAYMSFYNVMHVYCACCFVVTKWLVANEHHSKVHTMMTITITSNVILHLALKYT